MLRTDIAASCRERKVTHSETVETRTVWQSVDGRWRVVCELIEYYDSRHGPGRHHEPDIERLNEGEWENQFPREHAPPEVCEAYDEAGRQLGKEGWKFAERFEETCY